MSDENAIYAAGLTKSFGDTQALRGVDIAVATGTVCSLLGPNGAGKTTAVRILTTLLRPDAGLARVAGHDVAREPDLVRYNIGLAGQSATVDELLTGRHNLDMVGRLYHLPPKTARNRAGELLERFDLTDAADRPVKTYSGGMRRRLDLAASLVAAPPVLFLDEPTTGLDPRSRNGMWEVITELVGGGTTVLLTTQYLEEADQLADHIVVVDSGAVIAEGTAAELKRTVGGEQIDVVVRRADLAATAAALAGLSDAEPLVDETGRTVSIACRDGARSMMTALRALDAAGLEPEDVAVHRPTLDDVFLRLTGRAAEIAEPELEGASR